jgi:hypothetical protein
VRDERVDLLEREESDLGGVRRGRPAPDFVASRRLAISEFGVENLDDVRKHGRRVWPVSALVESDGGKRTPGEFGDALL